MSDKTADLRALHLIARNKVEEIWDTWNASEKRGVHFGLFPLDKMKAADPTGALGQILAIELMRWADLHP